jgi:RNA polymerase sigma-70 factor (ECF subfamily)
MIRHWRFQKRDGGVFIACDPSRPAPVEAGQAASPACVIIEDSTLDPTMQPSTSASVNGDAALVAQARDGDSTAFTELVNRYDRRIFRLAKHITQNEDDAQEILQDTFLKAYEHLPEFQGNSRFYTWLVRIAVNESLMKLRKRKSGKVVSLDETIDTGEETMAREIAVWEDNPEQRYSQSELRGILENAIDSLPPIFRSVFILRDVDELSTEETASALNISIPAVKSRLLRARLQLRDKLTRFFKRKGDDVFAYL